MAVTPCPICHAEMSFSDYVCPRWNDARVHLRGYQRGAWPKVKASVSQ